MGLLFTQKNGDFGRRGFCNTAKLCHADCKWSITYQIGVCVSLWCGVNRYLDRSRSKKERGLESTEMEVNI